MNPIIKKLERRVRELEESLCALIPLAEMGAAFREKPYKEIEKAKKLIPQEVRQGPSNYIRLHIPSFVDGVESVVTEFDTLEQLMGIAWVRRFSNRVDFHQFSLSENLLIAEYRGGREWWVCGHLKSPVDGLSKWSGGIYEVWDGDEAGEVEGSTVASTCGDVVTLRDGRTLKARRV